MQKEKLIIAFTVLVDVIGFGIVIPILPFYVSSFGASPFVITLLFSVFAFFAFLSSPYLGALSDRVGRRPVLLLSILSTSIGWFVFAAANSIPLLFLGRIIDGAAAGNFTVAQSSLVDIAGDEKERAANLGIVAGTFGVGFMVGPLLGGALSKVSHALPFWCAGLLALLNVVAAFFFLPETNKKRNPEIPVSVNPLSPLGRAFLNKKLRPLFVSWILFAVAFMASQTVFALFAERAFGFDSFSTGFLFTFMGVFMAFNQTVLLKRFWLRFFPEATLELIMIIVMGVGFLLTALQSLPLFYLSVALVAGGQSTLRVVMTSRAAGMTEPHRKGEVIGILTSLMAASMVIAPLLAGVLFEVQISLPYIFGATLMAIAVFIELRNRMKLTAAAPSP